MLIHPAINRQINQQSTDKIPRHILLRTHHSCKKRQVISFSLLTHFPPPCGLAEAISEATVEPRRSANLRNVSHIPRHDSAEAPTELRRRRLVCITRFRNVFPRLVGIRWQSPRRSLQRARTHFPPPLSSLDHRSLSFRAVLQHVAFAHPAAFSAKKPGNDPHSSGITSPPTSTTAA